MKNSIGKTGHHNFCCGSFKIDSGKKTRQGVGKSFVALPGKAQAHFLREYRPSLEKKGAKLVPAPETVQGHSPAQGPPQSRRNPYDPHQEAHEDLHDSHEQPDAHDGQGNQDYYHSAHRFSSPKRRARARPKP